MSAIPNVGPRSDVGRPRPPPTVWLPSVCQPPARASPSSVNLNPRADSPSPAVLHARLGPPDHHCRPPFPRVAVRLVPPCGLPARTRPSCSPTVPASRRLGPLTIATFLRYRKHVCAPLLDPCRPPRRSSPTRPSMSLVPLAPVHELSFLGARLPVSPPVWTQLLVSP